MLSCNSGIRNRVPADATVGDIQKTVVEHRSATHRISVANKGWHRGVYRRESGGMPRTVGIQDNFRFLHITVVKGVSVDDVDFPKAVQGAAGQGVEGDIGMKDVDHVGHIRGVQVVIAVLAIRGWIFRINVVTRSIYQTVVAGILVSIAGVV